jgi:hypothetical protein
VAGNLPSLGSRLDSAHAKLRRADQHIDALKQSLQRLGRRDLYENGTKPYDPGFAYLPSRLEWVPPTGIHTSQGFLEVSPARTRTLFRTIALVLTLTPKADLSQQYLRWGVLIGEIVHNIASALDNFIWELAQPIAAPPPATASSTIRSAYRRHLNEIGFPYTKKRSEWAGNCTRYLHFIPDSSCRAALEEAQAFFAWEQSGTDPDTFPLETIHEMWNRDKHRTINVTTTGLQLQVPSVNIPSLFPGVSELPSRVVKLFPLRPIEGETEMAVVHVDFPEEVEFPPTGRFEMTVNVHPKYTLAILFGQGVSVEGLNVLDTLQAAHELASQTVDKFS